MKMFIWSVTLFDCGFALWFAESFAEWECNPVARGLGVWPAVALRLATTMFFFTSLSWMKAGKGKYIWAVFFINAWLLTHYVR